MRYRDVLGACWKLLATIAASVALLPHRAAAEEHLYPHAERLSGPWGYIDKAGHLVIPMKYQAAEPFSEGLAAVKVDKKFGFIDRTGRVVIDFQFDWVQPFRGRRSNVRVGKAGRLIDEAGHTLIVHNFTSIEAFSEGLAVITRRDSASREEKAGVIDSSGRLVVEPEYERILPFSEGLAPAQRNGRYGFIDKNGTVVVPFQYGWASSFSEGRAKVWYSLPSTVTGFIDRNGNVAIPLNLGVANDFSEGLATVRVPGKGWGAIDRTGKVVISPRFANIARHHIEYPTGAFSDGLLAVADDKGFGYIDRHGTFIIQPQFVGASPFKEGLAIIQVSSQATFGVPHPTSSFAGVIDRSGKVLVKPIYDSIKIYPGGGIQVRFGDRMGYFDSTGRPLTFSAKDMEDYVARKRRQLEEELERLVGPRPMPGRAVSSKAGDIEYYLRLPEALCALDDSKPADRTFIEGVWAEQDKAQETLSALKPSLKKDEARTKEMLNLAKSRARFILPCDQLAGLRSGAGKQEIDSYITATGLHTDHYDRSSLGGAFWGHALMCGLMPGDVFKRSKTGARDESGSVATAFEGLRTGKPAVLRTMEMDYPAFCYHAFIIPPSEQSGSAPDLPLKAKLVSSAYLSTKDWTVHLVTRAVAVASADDFWQSFERDRTLLRDIGKANPLK